MLPGDGKQPPKGPRRGDVAILVAGSWPVWVRVPSREAAGPPPPRLPGPLPQAACSLSKQKWPGGSPPPRAVLQC